MTTTDTAITTKLTAATARQAIRDIVAAYESTSTAYELTVKSGCRCQCLVAMFYDRDGPAALDIEFPDSYLASALGISRQHVHRLKQAGRVLRFLSPVGDTDLNERQVRPLTKLLDRPDDLRSAYEAALTEADDTDTALTGRHVDAAVAGFLPPAESTIPNTTTIPTLDPHPITTDSWLYDLTMAAARWVDMLNGKPGAPQELLHAIEHVKKLAYALHQESAHEPDTLLHTT